MHCCFEVWHNSYGILKINKIPLLVTRLVSPSSVLKQTHEGSSAFGVSRKRNSRTHRRPIRTPNKNIFCWFETKFASLPRIFVPNRFPIIGVHVNLYSVAYPRRMEFRHFAGTPSYIMRAYWSNLCTLACTSTRLCFNFIVVNPLY